MVLLVGGVEGAGDALGGADDEGHVLGRGQRGPARLWFVDGGAGREGGECGCLCGYWYWYWYCC